MSFKRSRLKFLIMSDCLQYQEEGASRTKKENWSIIHQARNRLYTVDQEGAPYYPRGRNQKQGGAMAWPRLQQKKTWSNGISRDFDWRNIFDYLKKTLSCFITRKSSKNITCRFQRKILSMIFSLPLQRSVSKASSTNPL